MSKTSIDIAAKTRDKVCKLLQASLVDAIVLGLHAKQAHWNLRGPSFLALHKMYDELAADASEYADTLAERIKALGGMADGSPGRLAKESRLGDYPAQAEAEVEHLKASAASVAAFAKTVRAGSDLCAELGDASSADLFTELSRGADKWLWFIEAHGK